MQLLKCPRPEKLLEFVTIPRELSISDRLSVYLHKGACSQCQKRMQELSRAWDAMATPEPDITNSLLRVYSKLQSDETLILAGWKLGRTRPTSQISQWLGNRKQLYWGGTALAASLALVLLITPLRESVFSFKSATQARTVAEDAPYMQLRIRNKNSVEVRYVQPELLQTVEFETGSDK